MTISKDALTQLKEERVDESTIKLANDIIDYINLKLNLDVRKLSHQEHFDMITTLLKSPIFTFDSELGFISQTYVVGLVQTIKKLEVCPVEATDEIILNDIKTCIMDAEKPFLMTIAKNRREVLQKLIDENILECKKDLYDRKYWWPKDCYDPHEIYSYNEDHQNWTEEATEHYLIISDKYESPHPDFIWNNYEDWYRDNKEKLNKLNKFLNES